MYITKKIIKKATSMICMLTIITVLGMTAYASSETDTQRASLYKEYQEIAERIAAETGTEVRVLPAEEFAEEDWRSPEEFEKIVWQLVSAEVVSCENEKNDAEWLLIERSSVPAFADRRFTWGGSLSCTIRISASFKTQYNSGRQFISSVSSIDSQKIDGSGRWEKIGSDYTLLDSGRTAQVAVSGTISYAGVSTSKLLTAEFYCNANGGVSSTP